MDRSRCSVRGNGKVKSLGVYDSEKGAESGVGSAPF